MSNPLADLIEAERRRRLLEGVNEDFARLNASGTPSSTPTEDENRQAGGRN